MRVHLPGLLLVLALLSGTSASAGEAEIKRDVQHLASDELEGRGTGTPGGKLAAEYVANELRKAGLEPRAHPFTFLAGIRVGESTSLAFDARGAALTAGAKDDRFRPLGFSANGKAQGEVVFAGYGISAKDVGYDDYAGLDVKGKVVLLLDRVPRAKAGADGKPALPSQAPLAESRLPKDAQFRYGQTRYKVMNAREHGAAAVLITSAEASRSKEEDPSLLPLSGGAFQGDAGIVCCDVARSFAVEVVRAGGRSLDALQGMIDAELTPHSLRLPGVAAKVEVDLVRERREAANILAVRPGTDAALSQEAIILGAHMDHLGRGEAGSSLADAKDAREIHHGADDNASGTAAMLDVARTLPPTRRTVIFMAFSGEEMGLLGSAAYVKEPTIPLERTAAMINMDMVGRLGEKKLVVGGMGTAAEWPELVPAAAKRAGISFAAENDGYGPSDHASFYGKGVPVLFFFTGAHMDYHKPSDTWEKIDYPGVARIATLAREVILGIDALPAKPSAKTSAGNPHGGELEPSRGPSVYLGTVPDYSEQTEPGVRLSGVRDGSPAQTAGLKSGDVITSFDGHEVRNVQDYTYLLFSKKPGDKVVIVVKRGAETLTVTATMGRKGR